MSPHREGIPRNHRYQPGHNSFDEVATVSSIIKKISGRRNSVGPHRHSQGFAVDAGNIKESPKTSSSLLIIHLKEERQKDTGLPGWRDTDGGRERDARSAV